MCSSVALVIPRKEPPMLVLSRQRDQTIVIGDDIEITVVDIRGEKVRLGISAPAHIAVHRKEVYDSIKKSSTDGPSGAVRSLAKSQSSPKSQSNEKKE
jgi:carbon storage regulator